MSFIYSCYADIKG